MLEMTPASTPPTHVLAIEGMMCQQSCGTTVQNALRSVGRVRRAEVSYPEAKAWVWGEGVDEAAIRTALECFGTIVSIDTSASPVFVRFSTHKAARAARRAAAELANIAGGVDTVYNERSYDGRRGEAGRDDDDGRGW